MPDLISLKNYEREGSAVWQNVVLQVAARKNISPDDEGSLRKTATAVTLTRWAISQTAREVIGDKVERIGDYHRTVGSTIDINRTGSLYFKGISFEQMADLVTEHVANDRRPQDIAAVVRPYFERGSPDRRYTA